MTVRGSLDLVAPEYATGWIYSSSVRGDITVQAMLNQDIIGEAVANLHRPDLEKVGFGNGRCGFSIKFYRQIDPAYLPFVVVRPEGADTELPRWTPTGFVEFFCALYAAYPMCGRSRSVFGGLWTDRTDAAAQLKGKADIGLVPEEDVAAIASLIHQGIVIFRDGPSVAVGEELSADIIDPVLTAGIVRVLQLILDDRVVVVGAEIVSDRRPIGQASAERQLPSPGECLVVLAPLSGHPVAIDIVRDSQGLPEFNRDGISRWVNPEALTAGHADLQQHGLLDRYVLQPGSLAIIGPAVLHTAHCDSETEALRLLVVPARAVPLQVADDQARQETVTTNGVRIWL